MTTKPDKFELTAAEIKHVQDIINNASPGRYTLRQLFGRNRWDAVGDDGEKREYGGRFWQTYSQNKIGRISASGHKSNSLAYLIE